MACFMLKPLFLLIISFSFLLSKGCSQQSNETKEQHKENSAVKTADCLVLCLVLEKVDHKMINLWNNFLSCVCRIMSLLCVKW